MGTLYPVCGHCGYVFDEDDTWHGEYTVGKVYTGDGDESELKCPNLDCSRTFFVRCVHQIEFDQIDSDGLDI
jgi:hypothetical protein